MISVRRTLIFATYFFAFVAVVMIFQHEVEFIDIDKGSYRKQLLRGTNYIRSRIDALKEKAKELIYRNDVDDDDNPRADLDGTSSEDDDKFNPSDDDYAVNEAVGRIDTAKSQKSRVDTPKAGTIPVKLSSESSVRKDEPSVLKKGKVLDVVIDDITDDVTADDPAGDAKQQMAPLENPSAPAVPVTRDTVVTLPVTATSVTTVSLSSEGLKAFSSSGSSGQIELPKEAVEYISKKEAEITGSALSIANDGVDDGVDDKEKGADDLDNVQEPGTEAVQGEQRGKLLCNGTLVDSEVIYWKLVGGDSEYESPVTPHHSEHDDRYLTFAYDGGGWNNVRMGVECVIVMAHAMGRTLVIPPQQHLYLLDKTHKDHHEETAHDEMGFDDFFDISLLASHKGFHTISMQDFLKKEALVGGLHGQLPPEKDANISGDKLWRYLESVADVKPEWSGKFIAFPDRPGDFNLTKQHHPKFQQRLKAFRGQGFNDRTAVYYDETLQKAHHIHFPGDNKHRLLQHYYAFVFFAAPAMASFYKRFVRDYMRYKDPIQCAGAELVAAVRRESLAMNPDNNGDYYALHIRRGDFQYKDMKLGTPEILKNLHFPDGTPVIPSGSLVYISTDDPDGVCLNCFAKGKSCNLHPHPRPLGCPEDPSWNAFIKAGWRVVFLRDYLQKGYIKGSNPNTHGMIESIVCSRAKRFAGTFHSTFTGYIHRLRGYHGIGEESYFHTNDMLLDLRMNRSVGQGWPREWRAGWTDDGGQLI